MCLIALAWHVHPRYRLVLAANRDEFHARPTLPLAPWQDMPEVVGGRDVLHGGGWLALRGQRFAAVTNVRRSAVHEGRSRGALIADFVSGDADTMSSLHTLAHEATYYRPFNLLLHDGDTLAFATNLSDTASLDDDRHFAMRPLARGIHGVSNGAMDAPWPKTERLMEQLDGWLAASSAHPHAAADVEALFDALAETGVAPDAMLPETGIGVERERFLSSAFITHPVYGTRASTVVLIADDHAEIIERRFGAEGAFQGETRIRVEA